MNTCKNCGNSFEGNFCNHCGQKLITQRFTLKESLFWIVGSIFNFEKGFLHTTVEAIVRPGELIKSFIKGRTIRDAHPFRFVFIWATISALLGVYLNVYEESGLVFNEMAGQSEEQLERSRKVMGFMKQYMSFVMMFMIPFIAFGTYLVCKRKGLNYAEHLIMIAYGNGASIVIGLPILFAYFFVEDTALLSKLSVVLGILVMGRVLAQTVNDHIIIGILKYFVAFVLGMILLIIFFAIVTFITLLVMKKMGMPNPFA